MSIPPEFECPITLTIMNDPVIGDDGQTYERSAIEHWLADPRNNQRSPITRSLMRIDTLRTNFALKSQIERFLSQSSLVPAQAVPEPFVDCALTLEASMTRSHLHIKVSPPAEGDRQPALFFMLLDISGSTSENSGADLEKGAKDYTILDLCKHTVRTLGGILGPRDMLCLITYSSTAKVALKPTAMDKDGQKKLDAILKPIKAEGNTNIWAALELMDRIASAPEYSKSNISAALLTDGVSNQNPGRGVLEMFKLYGKPSLYNLSTFGFGYNIDSALLISLANASGGAFAFCPDFSMVATVFINWAATALASASKPKTIKVSFQDGSVASINTGTIQFGQARDFMVPLTSDIISITMDQQSATPTKVEGFQLEEMARFDLINSLKKLLEGNGSLTPLVGLYDKYKGTEAEHLMSEIKADGQVVLGTQPTLTHGQSYWTRWGRHYIPAYMRAHELQQRMNFKDAALQKYGSKTFEEIQTVGDHVFGTVDPFEPTGTMKEEYSPYNRVISPTSAYNARSVSPTSAVRPPRPVGSPMMSLTSGGGAPSGPGCWAPGSLIKMADGSKKTINDVRKGDLVWTIAGPSLVEYAVELNMRQPKQPMVQLGDLLITPWHPVLDKMVWRVPADLAPITDHAVQTVYNLVLAQGHIVEVGGILTVTLGHGFKGSVIEHAYFGNKDLIVYDLASQPGFAEGRPVYKNIAAKKNEGVVVGWFDDI
jgi:Mg-chelatase subunit ChlD